MTVIANYGRQVLKALKHLHKNKIYAINLHAGNVLVQENTDVVKLTDYESIFLDLSLKNVNCYDYIFTKYEKERIDDNESDILFDIFTPNLNLFEKVDVISFGRLIYEMYMGKELKAPYPDEIELNEIDSQDLKAVFNVIFPQKIDYKYEKYTDLPDVGVNELLKMKFFMSYYSYEDRNSDADNTSNKQSSIFQQNHKKTHFNQKNDILDLGLEFEAYSEVKEEIYKQKDFIKKNLKRINMQKV